MNYGGSRKTIASAYGNINGTRKQIFPYSATTVYTWNKYNRNTNQTAGAYSKVSTGGCSWNYGSNMPYTAGNQAYYTSESNISVESSTSFYSSSSWSPCQPIESEINSKLSGKVWFVETEDYNSSPGSRPESLPLYYGIAVNDSSYWSSDDYHGFVRAQYRLQITTNPTVTYSKGSYIGTVTSTNRNAYPNDGYSGSYWYVFVS